MNSRPRAAKSSPPRSEGRTRRPGGRRERGKKQQQQGDGGAWAVKEAGFGQSRDRGLPPPRARAVVHGRAHRARGGGGWCDVCLTCGPVTPVSEWCLYSGPHTWLRTVRLGWPIEDTCGVLACVWWWWRETLVALDAVCCLDVCGVCRFLLDARWGSGRWGAWACAADPMTRVRDRGRRARCRPAAGTARPRGPGRAEAHHSHVGTRRAHPRTAGWAVL